VNHDRSPRNDESDQGAVLVFVAVMVVVLLGMGALVVDVGRLYVERRELQNGADAAALAVAQDCAEGNCEDEVATAQDYADLNAKDGATALEFDPCGNGPGLPSCVDPAPSGASGASGWVRVGTTTETADGGDEVSFLFGRIISDLTGWTVSRSATAAWGTLGAGRATPLVFSQCEWEILSAGLPINQDFESFPGTITFHGQNPETVPCGIGPSGLDGPGGFGRVRTVDACSVPLTAGQWIPVDNGNDLARDCDLESWRTQVIEVAVFSETNGLTGSNLEYRIAGFVGFEVSGYRLVRPRGGGLQQWGSCPDTKPGDSYLCGKFVSYTTSSGSFGSGSNFGAQVIKMVE
jgi:hypothetical protein